MQDLTRFTILLIISLLYLSTKLVAQSPSKPASDSKKSLQIQTTEQVNPADYIFEGTVLQFEYHRDENDSLWLTHLIQIHKVFRGDLQPGTVELVFLATQPAFYIDNEPIYSNHGLGIRTKYTAPGISSKGKTAMFFAKASAYYPKTVLGSQASNTIKLTHPKYSNYSNYKIDYCPTCYIYKDKYELPTHLASLVTGYAYKHIFASVKGIYVYILSHPNTKLVDYTKQDMTVEYVWDLEQKMIAADRISSLEFTNDSTSESSKKETDKALQIYTAKQVNFADYIFEGTILDFKYHKDERDTLWLRHLIQIHKVFRGDLQPGTVEMVFLGRQPRYFSGNQPIYSSSGLGKLTKNTAPGGTRQGKTAIFFARENKKYPKTVLTNQVTNKIKLTYAQYTPGSCVYKINYCLMCHATKKKDDLPNYIVKLKAGELLVEGGNPSFGYVYKHVFPSAKDIYTYILSHPNTKLVDYTKQDMTVEYVWDLERKIIKGIKTSIYNK